MSGRSPRKDWYSFLTYLALPSFLRGREKCLLDFVSDSPTYGQCRGHFQLINLLFPYDNRLTYMWILIPWVYCLQELPDVPLFLSLHNLCATLKCTSPSAVIFRSAVINAGYRISGTHVNPLGLKSDAPMDVIWDIMRCWVRLHYFHSVIFLKYACTGDVHFFRSLYFHLCFFLFIFLESS